MYDQYKEKHMMQRNIKTFFRVRLHLSKMMNYYRVQPNNLVNIHR